MSSELVLAAFKETPLNSDPNQRYEVDASLKDGFKKAGLFANKVKGKLKKKLANYHTHEIHKHEGAAGKSKPNTMKHLYHDTMSKFHRMRLSHALSGRKHELHKTVHPSKIELQHNKQGEVKKPASRAEQAAHQHHQEHANNLAHAHNELKEKGFHKAADNVAKAHHDEASKAKSITKRRSMPKTEKVAIKEEAKPAEKKGRGAYARTDKHKNAIKTGKAEHEAVKQGRKMSDITTKKRITEKNHGDIKEARKGKGKLAEKPAKTTKKTVKEEKPKAEKTKKVAKAVEEKPKTSKRVKKVKEETPAPAAKKRGRPAGSKNKPKEPKPAAEKPVVKKTTTRRKKAA